MTDSKPESVSLNVPLIDSNEVFTLLGRIVVSFHFLSEIKN